MTHCFFHCPGVLGLCLSHEVTLWVFMCWPWVQSVSAWLSYHKYQLFLGSQLDWQLMTNCFCWDCATEVLIHLIFHFQQGQPFFSFFADVVVCFEAAYHLQSKGHGTCSSKAAVIWAPTIKCVLKTQLIVNNCMLKLMETIDRNQPYCNLAMWVFFFTPHRGFGLSKSFFHVVFPWFCPFSVYVKWPHFKDCKIRKSSNNRELVSQRSYFNTLKINPSNGRDCVDIWEPCFYTSTTPI